MSGIKRNGYLTFKYNVQHARHGWLRLTPAYSVRLVEQILQDIPKRPACVLEPFSGTGTTELVCAEKGIPAIAFDINPFLVWLAKVKTSVYSPQIIQAFADDAEQIAADIGSILPSCVPLIHNIGRWWGEDQLLYLARLKASISCVDDPSVRDLLKIAFCRLLIEISNADFNHVSTSFKQQGHRPFSDKEGNSLFLQICNMIQTSAKKQPLAKPEIFCHNTRALPAHCKDSFDTVITSPPYPNRISYIRELRPYMYWLDYLQSSEDSGNLDWETIGGTWGSATSKLASWAPSATAIPKSLIDPARKIAAAANKTAHLLCNYVLKYFEDIANHLQSVFSNIRHGGSVHYIVGNSCFFGNMVPSDEIYMELLWSVGFVNVKSRIIRKRNCNKSLYEYEISAMKPDSIDA